MQIPSDIAIWPFVVTLLIIILFLLWRSKPGLSYIVCLSIFIVYILLVLDKTLLPIEISGPYVDMMRQEPFMSRVNLIPFYFGQYGTFENSFSTTVLNVILTIPFGFGVNFVFRVRVKDFFWLSLVVGIAVEATQLLISLILSYPYRIIDINDVIMNTLGVWVGYGIFRIFAWLYVSVSQRLNIRHSGFANYIYLVALRVTATHNS